MKQRNQVAMILFEFEEKKAHFVFPTTNGLIGASMEPVGLSTSTRLGATALQ